MLYITGFSRHIKTLVTILTCGLSVLASSNSLASEAAASQALDTDARKKLPITIESDRAERDEKRALTVYSGNVEVRQGDIVITADTVTIKPPSEKHQSQNEILATGTPSKISVSSSPNTGQQPNQQSQRLTASANQITFNISNQSVLLKGNANLSQEGSEVTGEEISYEIKNSRIKANASDDNKGRVRTILQLSPNEESR